MDKTSMLGKVGFGLVLLALFLAPVLGGYPAGKDYGADVVLNALRALVLLGSAAIAFTDVDRTRSRAADVGVWALFGFTLLSLLVHSHVLTSPGLLFVQIPATLDWLCYALVFVIGARAGRRDPKIVWYMVGAILLSVAWAAISGAREYGQSVQTSAPDARATGPFFDPNFQAGFLALGLPLAVAGCLAARERLLSLGMGAVAALTIGALAATGSRGGFGMGFGGTLVTIAAAMIVGRSDQPRRTATRAALIVVALGRWLLAFTVPSRPESRRVAAEGRITRISFGSIPGRGTVAMAEANPLLGTGPGTYPYRYPPYAIVEKTGLAHSSYLQIAAEQGFPALLAALAALVLAGFACARYLIVRRDSDAGDPNALAPFDIRLIYCGIFGALIVGAGRSLFDSEWALLGNGLPFWAVAGLAASGGVAAVSPVGKTALKPTVSILAIALLPALCASLLLLHNVQTREAAIAAATHGQTVEAVTLWPPDPDVLYINGKPEEAAAAEPSARMYYRLGQAAEAAGDPALAVRQYRQSVALDPNNLKGWRTLADTQTRAGDTTGAVESYRELVRRYEGDSGRIRAIPELPETDPAFAYAAIADAAAKAGRAAEARDADEKAAAVIDGYSHTPPLYQSVEWTMGQQRNIDVAAKRQQVKDLYNRVMDALAAFPDTTLPAKTELGNRRKETLDRLDHFAGRTIGELMHEGLARSA